MHDTSHSVVPRRDAIAWHATLDEDGECVFRVGRRGDELIAEWVGAATLRAHRTDGSSELTVADGVGLAWRNKLERGLVRGMLGQVNGELTLHASAVGNVDRAVLMVGKSGAGKSTLAALLADRFGQYVLADDASPVVFEKDRALVEPADAELWLWGEARRILGLGESARDAKCPVAAGRVGEGPLPIAAIVVLAFGERSVPGLRRLRGHEALEPLLAATVRLVIDERSVQLREIAELEKLVTLTPVFELTRPRELLHLAESGEVVAALLRGEGGP